jgi:hypothetical protein
VFGAILGGLNLAALTTSEHKTDWASRKRGGAEEKPTERGKKVRRGREGEREKERARKKNLRGSFFQRRNFVHFEPGEREGGAI